MVAGVRNVKLARHGWDHASRVRIDQTKLKRVRAHVRGVAMDPERQAHYRVLRRKRSDVDRVEKTPAMISLPSLVVVA